MFQIYWQTVNFRRVLARRHIGCIPSYFVSIVHTACIPVARGGQMSHDPQNSSLSCRFVLREAMSQTKYCCSLKVKIFGPSQIFALAYMPLTVCTFHEGILGGKYIFTVLHSFLLFYVYFCCFTFVCCVAFIYKSCYESLHVTFRSVYYVFQTFGMSGDVNVNCTGQQRRRSFPHKSLCVPKYFCCAQIIFYYSNL